MCGVLPEPHVEEGGLGPGHAPSQVPHRAQHDLGIQVFHQASVQAANSAETAAKREGTSRGSSPRVYTFAGLC